MIAYYKLSFSEEMGKRLILRTVQWLNLFGATVHTLPLSIDAGGEKWHYCRSILLIYGHCCAATEMLFKLTLEKNFESNVYIHTYFVD